MPPTPGNTRIFVISMKVVVTGGSGQLGSLVLERLVLQRKIKKVVSLDLVPPIVPSPRIDWRIADMRDPGLERHLEGADALVHLAFIVARPASVETMRAVNVEGSRRIFEAAAEHGVGRIVYASSVAAYGIVPELPVPIVESSPRYRSKSLTYAENKYDVEEFLDAFEALHPEIAVVRLRPGILLGRRITHVSDGFLARRVMPVVSDKRGPIVWDEDVADAAVLALMGTCRGAYNLVASDSLPADEVARLAGFRPRRIPDAVLAAAVKASGAMSLLGEQRIDVGWIQAGQVEMTLSSEKARAELGWKPKYPTSADVAIAFGKQVHGRTDRRISLFLSMVPRLAERARKQNEMPRDAARMKLKIHLDLTGPRGGDFALDLDGGRVSLSRGIPRPPDSTVSLGADTFLELLAGSADPSTATMTGRIRVRGEPLGGLVFSGLVTGFRQATRRQGAAGLLARGLSKWFGERDKS
jgi:nucleoside-diphosphate-sugar epimerase/putative sterol carrier protein